MLCPKCKLDTGRRSHRHGFLEWTASVVAVYPYRCEECKLRFFRYKYSRAGEKAASGTEKEIRSTRRSIRWKARKRELLLYTLALIIFIAFLYFITRDRGTGESGAVRQTIADDVRTHC